MSITIENLMQDVVFGSEMKAREIAAKIGKRYPTLLRELNPADIGAKLGLSTAYHIMKITGNVKPLEFMASELGYRLEKKES